MKPASERTKRPSQIVETYRGLILHDLAVAHVADHWTAALVCLNKKHESFAMYFNTPASYRLNLNRFGQSPMNSAYYSDARLIQELEYI
jgi:hypothetical protein